MSELTDKIEEALARVEELSPAAPTDDLRKKLVAANDRLKAYKESGDKRGYLRALADALVIYRTLVIPVLQKQELLRLKGVLAMAKHAEGLEQNVVTSKSVSAAPQGVGPEPLPLAQADPEPGCTAVSGLPGGLPGASRRSPAPTAQEVDDG